MKYSKAMNRKAMILRETWPNEWPLAFFLISFVEVDIINGHAFSLKPAHILC